MKKFFYPLAALLISWAAGAPAMAQSGGDCGAEGANLTWTYADGTLTINGSGAMTDYSSASEVPWYSDRASITSVVLPSTLTYIGTYAFANTSIASIDLPSALDSIGSYAFSYCTSLLNITVRATTPPKTYATTFTGMSTNDVTLIVPDDNVADYHSADNWGSFYGFRGLTSGDDYCGDNLTWSVRNDTLYITGTGTEMWDYGYEDSSNHTTAHWYESTFTHVNFPTTITYIGEQAFRYCPSITTTNLSECTALETIGECGFYNCRGLISVDLSACTQMEHIPAYVFGYCYALTSLVLPNTVKSIYQSAIRNCTSLTSIVLPESLDTLGNYVFFQCYDLASVDFSACTNLKGMATRMFEQTSLTSVDLSKTQLTMIPDRTFRLCSSLTSVILPGTLDSIDVNAFQSCTGLAAITVLAETPPSIASTAFSGVPTSTCIVFVPDDKVDDYKAADNWSAFTHIVPLSSKCGDAMCWSVSGDTLYITGSGAMWDYTYGTAPWYEYRSQITSVVFPESITSIGSFAFVSCNSITSVDLPASLTSIGEGAFGYSGLASVDFSECTALTSIGDWVFTYCTSLTSIDLSACTSLTSIGAYAFWACTGLKTVDLPESLESIGNYAFQYCSALTSLTVRAENPPTIGENTFSGVDKSIPVYVPSGSDEDYQNAQYWDEFTNFVDEGDDDPTTGLNAATLASKVTVRGLEVELSVEAGTQVRVYSALGQVVLSTTEQRFTLPSAGIYIISVGGETTKVAARQ